MKAEIGTDNKFFFELINDYLYCGGWKDFISIFILFLIGKGKRSKYLIMMLIL